MRWSSPVPRAHGTRTASPPGGGRPAGRPSSRDRARDGLAALLPETARSMDSATPQLLIRARCSQSYPDLAVSSRPRACVPAQRARRAGRNNLPNRRRVGAFTVRVTAACPRRRRVRSRAADRPWRAAEGAACVRAGGREIVPSGRRLCCDPDRDSIGRPTTVQRFNSSWTQLVLPPCGLHRSTLHSPH